MSRKMNLMHLAVLIAMFVIQSCHKDKIILPTVYTAPVTKLSDSSLICGGNVVDDGGSIIIERGVCYNASPDPDISAYHTHDGSCIGSFSSEITGLSSNETYWL
jgi:hypothetical protein